MADRTPDSRPEEQLLALLRERRSIFSFLPDPVPTPLLERALEAGRWAPSHKLTEPWRFTILGPETKVALIEDFASFAVRKLPPDASAEQRDRSVEMARRKWSSKPAVVVVSQVLADDEFRREEDYASVACSIQNIMLAAWAMGLGSQWSTSPVTRDPAAMAKAGIPEGERVVGFVFFGFPAEVPAPRRKPLAEVLRVSG